MEEKILKQFQEDGFVLVEGLVSEKEVGAIAEELENLFDLDEQNIPETEPMLVCWRHKPDGVRSIVPLSRAIQASRLLEHKLLLEYCRFLSGSDYLQLFESVVFNKPAQIGEGFAWHNDASFYPFDPVDHISAWIAIDQCDQENGAMTLAAGSHQYGPVPPVDVKTGDALVTLEQENPLDDPEGKGFTLKTPIMSPGDVLFFSGYTWHSSQPNMSHVNRKGMAFRFLTQPTCYAPGPGRSATFVQHIDVTEGDTIDSPCFPIFLKND